MDTLLQQCSLQLYNLSNFGPVHEKTPMNICCHTLRVETWILQLLTGECTQVVLVKSNIGDIATRRRNWRMGIGDPGIVRMYNNIVNSARKMNGSLTFMFIFSTV